MRNGSGTVNLVDLFHAPFATVHQVTSTTDPKRTKERGLHYTTPKGFRFAVQSAFAICHMERVPPRGKPSTTDFTPRQMTLKLCAAAFVDEFLINTQEFISPHAMTQDRPRLTSGQSSLGWPRERVRTPITAPTSFILKFPPAKRAWHRCACQ